jgi:thioredoxin 1
LLPFGYLGTVETKRGEGVKKKNAIIGGLLVVSVVVIFAIKSRERSESCPSNGSGGCCELLIPPDPEMPNVSVAVQEPLPRLLDLGADKCIPCKAMAPILDEMKETFSGQLDVDFIDVWKNESAAQPYGIRLIPTQIFFDGEGNELFRHEGFFSREDLLAKWEELGFFFEEQE